MPTTYQVPYELAAMRGDPDPENISSFDLQIYQGMKYIYRLYSQKELPEMVAKTIILMLRSFYTQSHKNAAEAIDRGKFWQKIEPYARQYVFDPTVENGDKFYAAVYGLSGDWRCQRAINAKRNEADKGKEVTVLSAKTNN